MTRVDLSTALRKALEKAVEQARIAAGMGAADAIRRLGVAAASPPTHLNVAAKALRVRLRAHARSLGDNRRTDDSHNVERLIEEAAYAHWHRLLFARFLLERRLLREPESGGEVTLDDCRELAGVQGLPDAWAAAERFASAMLPGVFRPDDPVLALDFAPEHAAALQRILQSLDPAIFQADDSLGWTYQFWRAAEKDAVNRTGEKIGADSLPAVTQLFTEPYMVRFLLHNTLGAWWAGKVLAANAKLARDAADEATLRIACALPGIDWEYLRFVKEIDAWRPAAGTFAGWPREAKAISVMDPCCGSGHFLVEAFAILAALRLKEETLAPATVAAAVLNDNLFGLEIDGRCVQLASFAIALAAWRLGGSAAALPNPHIAWVGAPPPLPRQDLVALANGDADLGLALGALHDLFVLAPLLGSLLRPTGGDLVDPLRVARIETMLDPVVARLRAAEPERAEGAIAARGMADAAELLARKYVLQATNVPYLGRGKQMSALAEHIARHFSDAKADLAAAMLSRMMDLSNAAGTVTAVTPQNWLFLGSYRAFRERLLVHTTLNMVAGLGPRAFETIGGEVVSVILVAATAALPTSTATFTSLDANNAADPVAKSQTLSTGEVRIQKQKAQLANPDHVIATLPLSTGTLLQKFAEAVEGLSTGDNHRFTREFWEVKWRASGWELFAGAPDTVGSFRGRSGIVAWDDGRGPMASDEGARIQGHAAWGKTGVLVGEMSALPATLYGGEIHEKITAAIVPHDTAHLPAIWAFIASDAYRTAIRKVNLKLSVATGTLVKIPFDLPHWRDVAAKSYPNGLPEPYSDDPTQWLFHGHPAPAMLGSQLHIALARLAGYRWPAESDSKVRLAPEGKAWVAKAANLPASDADGLLCLPAVAGERALADRLRGFLAAVFGKDWSEVTERRLLAETNERYENRPPRDASLEGWLRDRAFRQHCVLFHQRPFLWHIWDGQKDGFAALVHYDRLTHANLEKLTYSLLGDWIGRMRADNDGRRLEAATILQQQLQTILEGEEPYDIFVRWKPLAQQPLGWEPDLDDGVRMNIRPFVEAEILRDVPNIKWTKDRGNNARSAPWFDVFKGERINDHHTTLAQKRKARGLK
jgi:hypothetical protein